jgi:hypothetical protein
VALKLFDEHRPTDKNKWRDSSTKLNDLVIYFQGSVLADLLFIIYINDLKQICKKVKINFFVDDTLLYVATSDVKEAQNIMNEELGDIFECSLGTQDK